MASVSGTKLVGEGCYSCFLLLGFWEHLTSHNWKYSAGLGKPCCQMLHYTVGSKVLLLDISLGSTRLHSHVWCFRPWDLKAWKDTLQEDEVHICLNVWSAALNAFMKLLLFTIFSSFVRSFPVFVYLLLLALNIVF